MQLAKKSSVPKQNKKRFWDSETFWEYVVPIIVSVIISILTTLVASGLGLVWCKLLWTKQQLAGKRFLVTALLNLHGDVQSNVT